MTEAKRETKCNMDYKIFLILSLILLTPLISANTFGYNYLNNQPTGNITNEYINNTYINQTLELNSTQFETGEPATIKKSWLTSFIESISKWANYYTITEIDNRYSNNTGDQNLSTYVQGNMSSETTTTYTPTNGSALSFDGVNDVVETTFNPNTHIGDGNPFTISAWINPKVNDKDWIGLSGVPRFYARLGASPLFGLGSSFNTMTGLTYTTGEWQFIVFVYNQTNILAYKNGNLVSTQVYSGDGNMPDVLLNIGGASTIYNMNGSLDEVLIFNRSLNSTEIEQLYNSGVGLYANSSVAPFDDGLVSGWHFDEGSGTTAIDVTGRNNGTLVNGPSWGDGKVPHNIATQVLGAIGLMPWVSATNFISTDFSLQWIGNTLKNPWNTISTLGNFTNRWNVHLNNVTMNGTQGWSGNCVNSSILNGIIVGCND